MPCRGWRVSATGGLQTKWLHAGGALGSEHIPSSRFDGSTGVFREMKPSNYSGFSQQQEPRSLPFKAADSHQAAAQPRETPAGVLTAWRHMLKGSEPSRGSVVELSVRPGHQAVTASVCSTQTLRYLVSDWRFWFIGGLKRNVELGNEDLLTCCSVQSFISVQKCFSLQTICYCRIFQICVISFE